MFWILAILLSGSCFAHLWGGHQLSITGSDVIHISDEEAILSEVQVIRSREFRLPKQTFSYSKDDKVASIYLAIKLSINLHTAAQKTGN